MSPRSSPVRERTRESPELAVAAGAAIGLLAALGALAAGVDRRVALTLWLGVATVAYYRLRYGSPPGTDTVVPARTAVQASLFVVLIAAFVPSATAPLRYAATVAALGSAVLAVALTVLAEATDWGRPEG